ncbi:MAG: hypothetical protein SP1CHLAM54_02920 [Chlamydiia bacterium]|nr:hypothetical protein [Chlamydiia bacterium]MCH9615208.1 hypothetical protein [Chlamydiia bacterium]MCH9628470.1 hypothetical protein [Chlamydiia bacterium]
MATGLPPTMQFAGMNFRIQSMGTCPQERIQDVCEQLVRVATELVVENKAARPQLEAKRLHETLGVNLHALVNTVELIANFLKDSPKVHRPGVEMVGPSLSFSKAHFDTRYAAAFAILISSIHKVGPESHPPVLEATMTTRSFFEWVEAAETMDKEMPIVSPKPAQFLSLREDASAGSLVADPMGLTVEIGAPCPDSPSKYLVTSPRWEQNGC